MKEWPKGAAVRITIEVRSDLLIDDLRVVSHLRLDPPRDPTPAEAMRAIQEIASRLNVPIDLDELRRTVELLTKPPITGEASKP